MKSPLALSISCLLSLGCSLPVPAYAKGAAPLDAGGDSRISYKGKVSRFAYYINKDPHVPDPGGCKIQIDTAPGITFMIYMEITDENRIGKEGICLMAYDSLRHGREITMHEEFGAITEISMSL